MRPKLDQPIATTWLSLQGRISRRDYWLKFVLPIAALGYFLSRQPVMQADDVPFPVLSTPAVLAILLCLWLAFLGSLKRLRDIGWPAWTAAALVMSGPLLGILIESWSFALGRVFARAWEVALVALALWLGIARGTAASTTPPP